MLSFELITHKQLYSIDPQDGGEGLKEGSGWSVFQSLIVLIVATSLVALMSEFLVGAVEAARSALGLTEVFVGVIVIAVIGNAAEHSTAVMMAMKNKMSLSLGIAVGSSLQIALFVAPVLVFSSYLLRQSDGFGVYIARGRCGDRRYSTDLPDQRRRRNELA